MPSSSPRPPSNLLKQCWWKIGVEIQYQVQAAFTFFPNVYFNHLSLYFWLLAGPGSKRPKCQEGGKRPVSFWLQQRRRWTLRCTSLAAHALLSYRANRQGSFHGCPRPLLLILVIIFQKVCHHQQSIEYWGLDTQARFQHLKLHLCWPLGDRWIRKTASKNNQKFSLINRRENKTGQGLNFMTLSMAAF